MKPYTLQLQDDCGSGRDELLVEAESDEEANAKVHPLAEAWVREGEWGDEGARIQVLAELYTGAPGEPGDLVSDEWFAVDVEPNHARLMADAGADPDCNHEWTGEGHGGCDENPGVYGLGGTAISIREHCTKCGLIRTQRLTGSQYNPGEHDTVSYAIPEEECV